jgi:hypothetical protein
MLTFKMITMSEDLYWNSKCEKVSKLNIQVFWNVKSCRLLRSVRCFRVAGCFWNVRNYLPSLWEPQIFNLSKPVQMTWALFSAKYSSLSEGQYFCLKVRSLFPFVLVVWVVLRQEVYKFGTVATDICRASQGTCFMSYFWHLEFWGGF